VAAAVARSAKAKPFASMNRRRTGRF